VIAGETTITVRESRSFGLVFMSDARQPDDGERKVMMLGKERGKFGESGLFW